MIETNEYVGYDTDLHFYYLTEAGLRKYVINGEVLAGIWNNVERRLKLQAKLLHDEYTKSAYNGQRLRYRHKDLIEYRIFKNEYGERQSIIDALVYFAEVVEDTDLDRDIMSGEKKFPMGVLNPLKQSGVHFRGKILDYVPENEYRVGY